MRSTTKDEYADDRGCAVGLATDDEEKGSTSIGERQMKQRSNPFVPHLDGRVSWSDKNAAKIDCDTYGNDSQQR